MEVGERGKRRRVDDLVCQTTKVDRPVAHGENARALVRQCRIPSGLRSRGQRRRALRDVIALVPAGFEPDALQRRRRRGDVFSRGRLRCLPSGCGRLSTDALHPRIERRAVTVVLGPRIHSGGLIVAHHPLHVALGFGVRRNAVELRHPTGTGIIGRGDLGGITVELVRKLGKVFHSPSDVLFRIVRIYPKAFCGGRHELHHAHRALGRNGIRVEVAFRLGDRRHEVRVQSRIRRRRIEKPLDVHYLNVPGMTRTTWVLP